MGYAKWQLGKGDDFQTHVALWRVACLLDAHARDIEGPVELASEIPIDEWDDIVEFGSQQDALTATHYQVKRQYADFKKDDREDVFVKLFESAARILGVGSPYDGYDVRPEQRNFNIVLPRADAQVGTDLNVDQLSGLLEDCAGTAAETIVANRGVNLSGRSGGDQKRTWLALIFNASGTADRCVQLLQRLKVRFESPLMVRDRAYQLLDQLVGDPGYAKLLISDAIRHTPPEGRLHPEVLLPALEKAGPKRVMNHVRITQSRRGGYFVRSYHQPTSDLNVVTSNVVNATWTSSGAADLHIAFPPPATSIPLRKACVRLLLHARQSPVHVMARDEWLKRSIADVRGTLGLDTGNRALDGVRYKEEPHRLVPNSGSPWPPDAFGEALHAAMDEHVWARVQDFGMQMLRDIDGVPFADVAESMKVIKEFLARILRGWWPPEEDASGVGIARAGPGIADRVALVVVGVVLLKHLGFEVVVNADSPPSLASVSGVPIRGLAIEHFGEMDDDGLWKGFDLKDRAVDILASAGIVLVVKMDVEEVYNLARASWQDSPGGHVGIHEWTPSAFLIDSSSLLTWAKRGERAAKEWILEKCRKRAARLHAALEAALTTWGESDAA